jgi:hypothetical protein
MSWECTERKNTGGGEARISEAKRKNLEAEMKSKASKEGISLMMRKILINPEKEVRELVHRNSLFITSCKTKDMISKVIIDTGSTDNLVSMEMVEKLKLETTAHLNSYKVLWLQKGHQFMVSRQCKVEFKIGGYNDEVLCDGIPMDVCHVLLGRL